MTTWRWIWRRFGLAWVTQSQRESGSGWMVPHSLRGETYKFLFCLCQVIFNKPNILVYDRIIILHVNSSLRMWRVGEPNNSDGNENCVVFVSNTPTNPQHSVRGRHPNTLQVWNDVPCSRSMPFICEQKLPWKCMISCESALIAKIFEQITGKIYCDYSLHFTVFSIHF